MIELRNGKLKIDSKRSALEILLDLSIVAMLTVLFAFNFRFGERNYIYHAALISVVGLTFFVRILGRPSISIKLPTIWYGIFVLLCVVSSLWAAYNVSYTLHYIPRMLQVMLFCYCVTLYIETREDFERFTALFTAAVMIMIFSIFVRTPYSMWFSGFFGRIGYEKCHGQ